MDLQELEDVLCKLYPSREELTALSRRAGGDGPLPQHTSVHVVCSEWMRKVENGHRDAPVLSRLVGEALKEYPRNQVLEEYRRVLELPAGPKTDGAPNGTESAGQKPAPEEARVVVLADGLVRFDACDGAVLGYGYGIAEDRILTCAAVLPDEIDVLVGKGQDEYEADVVLALDGGARIVQTSSGLFLGRVEYATGGNETTRRPVALTDEGDVDCTWSRRGAVRRTNGEASLVAGTPLVHPERRRLLGVCDGAGGAIAVGDLRKESSYFCALGSDNARRAYLQEVERFQLELAAWLGSKPEVATRLENKLAPADELVVAVTDPERALEVCGVLAAIAREGFDEVRVLARHALKLLAFAAGADAVAELRAKSDQTTFVMPNRKRAVADTVLGQATGGQVLSRPMPVASQAPLGSSSKELTDAMGRAMRDDIGRVYQSHGLGDFEGASLSDGLTRGAVEGLEQLLGLTFVVHLVDAEHHDLADERWDYLTRALRDSNVRRARLTGRDDVASFEEQLSMNLRHFQNLLDGEET